MNERYPVIGERWQYKKCFILEITIVQYVYSGYSCDKLGFKGNIVQNLNGSLSWELNTSAGDLFENISNWSKLEGQDKPI
jgi:hypothetical protein